MLINVTGRGPIIFNFYSSLPIQWQKSTTLQRVPDTTMHIKIIYISVQGKSIDNIQNYEDNSDWHLHSVYVTPPVRFI
jgi:hypothetical protein